MKNATPREIVERLRKSLETRNNNEFIDQFADDGVFELPFALEGSEARFEGINEIRKRFGITSSMGKLLEIHKVTANVYENIDPEVVTAEFMIEGKSLATGKSFNLPSSICVIKIRNGKIINYRDYPNTLGGAQIAGMLSQFAASLIN